MNRRSWVYRIRPSAAHPPFRRIGNGSLRTAPFTDVPADPNRVRWDPFPVPDHPADFVDGLFTIGGNGDAAAHAGIAIHWYAANACMRDRCFVNADGEFLVVPQAGRLLVRTEFGRLGWGPGRSPCCRAASGSGVELLDPVARRLHLRELRRAAAPARARADRGQRAGQRAGLPRAGRGVRGARGHRPGGAEVRRQPVGAPTTTTCRWTSSPGTAPTTRTATTWRVHTMGTVSFDHPDPSIFTVLTSPTDTPGTPTWTS